MRAQGETMATSSICLKSVLAKLKCESLVARYKSSLNSDLFHLSTVSDSLKSLFVLISMVQSKGMLVNRESTSKKPIKKPGY